MNLFQFLGKQHANLYKDFALLLLKYMTLEEKFINACEKYCAYISLSWEDRVLVILPLLILLWFVSWYNLK